MSYSKAKGECKDGIPQFTFPDSTSVASRCVTNLNPAPQVETPGQLIDIFSQEDWACVSVCYLCSVLGLVAFRELSLQLFQTCGAQKCYLHGQKSPALKEHPLCMLYIPHSPSRLWPGLHGWYVWV